MLTIALSGFEYGYSESKGTSWRECLYITPERIIVEGTIETVYEASRMIRVWIYGDIYTVFSGEIFETKRLADKWLKDNA